MYTKLAFVAAGTTAFSAAGQSFMMEYNLLVEGDLLLSTSEVDGSAMVGGSLLGGTSNYTTQLVTASNNTGLAVGNVLAAGVNVNVNNGGDFRIGSAANQLGNVNLNGGGSTIIDPSVASTAAAYANQARTASAYLGGLAATGTIDGAGNMSSAGFHSLDGQNVAVYDLTQNMFDSGLGQLNLNFGAADTVIINYSTGGIGIADLTSPPNIIGDFNQANSSRILWNFVDATDITTNNTFNGAMLAPDAALTLDGGGINGSVVVNSLELQNAEVRLNLYTGYVPAPASVALLPLAGLGASRRRR